MQKLFIAGSVGKDAVLRRTQNGDPILGFSLAVDNGKDKDATWYDASVFGKRGGALDGHIKKGTKLALTGKPSVRVHEGKAYLGIMVDELTFMGGGDKKQESDSYGNQPANFGDDNEIPFSAEWR